MNRDQFIKEHTIEGEFFARGIKLVGNSKNKMAVCPFHDDKTPSLSVDTDKQLWNCFGCQRGGSVIDLIAAFESIQPSEVLKRAGGASTLQRTPFKKTVQPTISTQSEPEQSEPLKEVAVYVYKTAQGNEVYRVHRYHPKTFRQSHRDSAGKTVWGMNGVQRVLYRMPEVSKSDIVAFAEGEKDAETLTALGFCGTCNVGGAGKWMDAYTESLAGKRVLLFGDNDEAGKGHVNLVFESIAGKSEWVKIIPIPQTFKDVTEYVESFNSTSEAKAAIEAVVSECHPFVKGHMLPVYSMAELEARYKRLASLAETSTYNLGKWLPSFNRLRRLVPGEFVVFLGNTGTGKTAILQNIALSVSSVKTLMFELELPAELLFERFIARHNNCECRDVEQAYSQGQEVGEKALQYHFRNLLICPRSLVSVEDLESYIIRSELKFGERPRLVLLDYMQLMKGDGKSRYERASNVAEGVKRVAVSTQTIIIASSQISRPEDDSPEVGLHDAKESGSIENSCGVLVGVWRDAKDSKLMHMKVLKSTKGGAGTEIKCNFDGATMTITERAN